MSPGKVNSASYVGFLKLLAGVILYIIIFVFLCHHYMILLGPSNSIYFFSPRKATPHLLLPCLLNQGSLSESMESKVTGFLFCTLCTLADEKDALGCSFTHDVRMKHEPLPGWCRPLRLSKKEGQSDGQLQKMA